MNTINILKPDIFSNKESLDYYFENILSINNIESIKLYCIDDWVKIASMIYEYDVMVSSENKLEHRKRLLSSILGYHHIYSDDLALAIVFDINKDENTVLQMLHLLKKDIRKKFVANTDLYYLRYIDQSDEVFNMLLPNIDIASIEVDIKRFPNNKPLIDTRYNMIYFNQVHGPNPSNLKEIEHSIKVLYDREIICEKKLVKVLKK